MSMNLSAFESGEVSTMYNSVKLSLLFSLAVLLHQIPIIFGFTTVATCQLAYSLDSRSTYQPLSVNVFHRTSKESLHVKPKRHTQLSTVISAAIGGGDEDDPVDEEALLDYLDQDNLAAGVTFEEYLEQQRREDYLRSCLLFQRCSASDITRIAKAMILEKVSAGDKLVSQGDFGSSMYFLQEGSIEAIRDVNGTKETLLTYTQEGEVFGELSLVFDQPRTASIFATQDSVIYRLDKAAFLDSVVDSPIWETAKSIILNKYEGKRLIDILSKASPGELVGLLNARLLGRFSTKRLFGTIRTFALGAAAVFATKVSSVKATIIPLVYLAFGLLAYIFN